MNGLNGQPAPTIIGPKPTASDAQMLASYLDNVRKLIVQRAGAVPIIDPMQMLLLANIAAQQARTNDLLEALVKASAPPQLYPGPTPRQETRL